LGSNQVLILLIIGYVIFTIDKKKKYFPVPVVLLVIGAILSTIPYFSQASLTKDTIFHLFLPSLLFISAYQFSIKEWKRHAILILILSTLGIILTTFILSGLLFFALQPFSSLTYIESLLIATILTPTDPVSVVSILKQVSSQRELADIVEGESMINDGTSIVLFTVIAGIYMDEKSFSATSFLSEFLLVSFGGVAVGVLLSLIVTRAVHLTSHHEYRVMLSIILAYGSFYLGEWLGVSGVLSTVSSGILLSWKYGQSVREESFRKDLDRFWGVIEPSILTILFLLIGIEFSKYVSFSLYGWMFFIFILTLIVRYLILACIVQFANKWKRLYGWKEINILTLSGIKGTMSVALLLSLEGNGPTVLYSLTFGVIILSLVLQSMAIYPLSKQLKNK
jgi:monovalent cation:H+ antiporter, CPA1 family